jgi:hypothetical protein
MQDQAKGIRQQAKVKDKNLSNYCLLPNNYCLLADTSKSYQYEKQSHTPR